MSPRFVAVFLHHSMVPGMVDQILAVGYKEAAGLPAA